MSLSLNSLLSSSVIDSLTINNFGNSVANWANNFRMAQFLALKLRISRWHQVADWPIKKHCKRHNGPKGWVHLAKVSSWGHITNLDHILSSESRLSINQKSQPNISIPTKLKIQNLDQTPASESRPRFFFINSTKHQRQNAEQTPASKSCLNFDFNPWA